MREPRTPRPAPRRSPLGRAFVGTALALIVLGAVLVLAIDVPEVVTRYVDVLDFGLILVWTGILMLGLTVWFHRPPRRRPRRVRPSYDGSYDGEEPHDTGDWRERDVHRPGYAGQTRRLPTIRHR